MVSKRALLSVSDKTGIVDFARELVERGWTLISTGGTARALREAGLDVLEVAGLTGQAQMMGGRIKTLHPAIHAGILARRDMRSDMTELRAQRYGPIDMVVVNLYPFRETIAEKDATLQDAMDNVDIGGPTMLRAAAKNHEGVWPVVDHRDYARVLQALDDEEGELEAELRKELAAKVFQHVSTYDAAIASYLVTGEDGAPFTVSAPPLQGLRYGENPDQKAAFYRLGVDPVGVAALKQSHGKDLSYNNILDVDGGLMSMAPFAYASHPTACIVKHTTPCGLAMGETITEAFQRALATDPVSAFGSVVILNRPVDEEAAEVLKELFIECLVAPGYEKKALKLLRKKKSIRVMTTPEALPPVIGEPEDEWFTQAPEEIRTMARFLAEYARKPEPRTFRTVYGGVLVQTPPLAPFYAMPRYDIHDAAAEDPWKVVTERDPTAEEWDDLSFAWGAVYGVKSNAILLAKDRQTLGIGAGQMSRVDASRVAVQKAADAELELKGAVLASDAFFPFRDGVDAAAEAGIKAIIQPGGSKRDDEVIEAADEHGIAMVMTGRRLFRH